MKIYISGKITGIPFEEFVLKFNNAACFLLSLDYEPINPLTISPHHENKTWEDYMLNDIKALFECEAIYMLNDWKDSKGARIEHAIAKELSLKIIYQTEMKTETTSN